MFHREMKNSKTLWMFETISSRSRQKENLQKERKIPESDYEPSELEDLRDRPEQEALPNPTTDQPSLTVGERENLALTEETIVEEGPAIDLTEGEPRQKRTKLQEPLDDYPEEALQPYLRGQLQSAWSKSGTSGAGARVLQKLEEKRKERARSKSRGDPKEDEEERTAFVSERIEIPKGTNKNVRKQMT